jgi:hypothetical protein
MVSPLDRLTSTAAQKKKPLGSINDRLENHPPVKKKVSSKPQPPRSALSPLQQNTNSERLAVGRKLVEETFGHHSIEGTNAGAAPKIAIFSDDATRTNPTTFEEVRQVFIEFRDSTGYAGWKTEHQKKGWNNLESFTAMVDLGTCGGVRLKNGQPYMIGLPMGNLVGTLPPSLAKLDTLVELYLNGNNLHGCLPAHIGSPTCLSSLKKLDVQDNRHLGGKIEAHFLINCKTCNINRCSPTMQIPYLSGATLSRDAVSHIFAISPREMVTAGRVQGAVAELTPENGGLWKMATRGLLFVPETWSLWQKTWLTELRTLTTGCLFVFITKSFEEECNSAKYITGGRDDSDGSFKSAKEWCKEQSFDRSFGFGDEGWGFDPGTKAANKLDFERLHLQSVSRKKGLPTVFICLRGSKAKQVAAPAWYAYNGSKAPLGAFVWSEQESRLVLAAGAIKGKTCAIS